MFLFIVILRLLVVLAVLTVALAVLRALFFLFSNWRSGHLAYIRKESGGLILLLLKIVYSSSWSMGAAGCLFPLALVPESEPLPGRRPVILVHGLYHNRATWLVFLRRLKKSGYTDVHTFQYNSWTADFDGVVAGLKKKLDSVLGADPARQAVLVGHSLGGLVIRAAAADPAYGARIVGMATLGAPHGGAELAFLGLGGLARSLTPDGAAIRSIRTIKDADCPKLSVHTLTDDIVFPLDKLQPTQPGWNIQVCPGETHVSLLFSARAYVMVLNFLEKNGALDRVG